ncbi:hypothetical protein [Streptomyces sp. NBC_00212]|uniref:hypothetical protein n=1 Tax=Streptomyces sp. NBC_00212 TaxID=2975684 RepID=UPI00386E5399
MNGPFSPGWSGGERWSRGPADFGSHRAADGEGGCRLESERLGLVGEDDVALIVRSLTEPQIAAADLQVPAEEITTVYADPDVDTVLATAAASGCWYATATGLSVRCTPATPWGPAPAGAP